MLFFHGFLLVLTIDKLQVCIDFFHPKIASPNNSNPKDPEDFETVNSDRFFLTFFFFKVLALDFANHRNILA